MSPVRVLIVDDSALARSVISRRLSADPEVLVVGQAANGEQALASLRDLKPDVITLDVQMPRMDGLAALGRIMAESPTPVVMLSSLTGDDTETTIKALELGAIDFFLKPAASSPAGFDGSGKSLVETVKMAAAVPRSRLGARPRQPQAVARPSVSAQRPLHHVRGSLPRRAVVIGSSTGGPRALMDVVPHLPAELDAGYLLVQHMPPGFTKSLAERLRSASAIEVKEAATGDRIESGKALMAPGGFHMEVDASGVVSLTQAPPLHGVRPAVDVTMETAVRAFGAATVGVVLTGMGMDGARGCGLIKAAGGHVAVQDESTCAVYGMPKSVVDAGHADVVAPITRIANEVVRLCSIESRRDAAGAA